MGLSHLFQRSPSQRSSTSPSPLRGPPPARLPRTLSSIVPPVLEDLLLRIPSPAGTATRPILSRDDHRHDAAHHVATILSAFHTLRPLIQLRLPPSSSPKPLTSREYGRLVDAHVSLCRELKELRSHFCARVADTKAFHEGRLGWDGLCAAEKVRRVEMERCVGEVERLVGVVDRWAWTAWERWEGERAPCEKCGCACSCGCRVRLERKVRGRKEGGEGEEEEGGEGGGEGGGGGGGRKGREQSDRRKKSNVPEDEDDDVDEEYMRRMAAAHARNAILRDCAG